MNKRIHSIDFMRGLVMVIMALDHVRDLMHVDAITQNPTDLVTTTPFLFFTRFITHFCAPTFVFLSGASVYISLKNKENIGQTQWFLLSRGLWLILLEYTIVNFGIWFDINFGIILSQVIAAIGFGFVLLAILLRLPAKVLGILGLLIILTHDLVTSLPSSIQNPDLKFVATYLFALNAFPLMPDFTFVVSYPIIPWFGIMLVGYAAGLIFDYPLQKRKRTLLAIGASMLVIFAVVRYTNLYGDLTKWSVQKNATYTFLSFINVSKYPPSFLYTFLTLGVMIVVLSYVGGLKGKFVKIISVYGKVPLFYYLIHWYLIHILMIGMLFIQGFTWEELNFASFTFGRPTGKSGLDLSGIYLVWISVVIVMYPLCEWYGNYKMDNSEKKWLRYL